MRDPLCHDNLSAENSSEFYLQEIAALKATIALMEGKNRSLQRQVGLGSRRTALMQSALTQCRQVIEDYQSQGKTCESPSREQHPPASLPWGPLRKAGKSALTVWGLPKKSDVPRYISRTELENMVLLTATTIVGGILGVVIEAKQKADSGGRANWRITGIISGKADRCLAIEAVTRAAQHYVDWIVVDGGSHLHGRAIAKMIGSGPPRDDASTLHA